MYNQHASLECFDVSHKENTQMQKPHNGNTTTMEVMDDGC